MNSITFYVDNEDIVCDFNCENIEFFKVLIFSLFSGRLTESTLGYIIKSLAVDGRTDESKTIELISAAFNKENRPIIEASQFR